MTDGQARGRPSVRDWRRQLPLALLVVVACFGAGLRFVETGAKPYWFNEVFTSIRAAGITDARRDFSARYLDTPVATETILGFQRPSAGTTPLDTARALGRREAQHPPAYFVLVRQWMWLFGHQPGQVRLLSALFGALGIAALGWLAFELFRDRRVALLSAALMAVSPLFLRYAQEARPYSLWILLVIVASALLLRAARTDRRSAWILYAGAVSAASWTHLLTLPVIAGHAVYVAVSERFRLTANMRRFLIAAGIAALTLVPWMVVLAIRSANALASTAHLGWPVGGARLLEAWAGHLGHLFASFDNASEFDGPHVTVPALVLCATAVVFLIRVAPRRDWLFLLAFSVPTLAVTLLPDLVLGGQRSLRPHYALPTFVGLIVAVAFLLGRSGDGAAGRSALVRGSLAAGLLLIAAVSSNGLVRAPTWWGLSQSNADLIALLQSTPKTLVVTDLPFELIVTASHDAPDEARFLLVSRPEALRPQPGFARHLLYQPSSELLAVVTRRTGSEPVLLSERARGDRPAFRIYEFANDRMDQPPP